MKKHFYLVLVMFAMLFVSAEAQLPNQNMVLLKNLNQHGTNYSALWGWTAPNGREYAILGCNTGTSFVDITDSANIHECAFRTGVTSQWREMKTYSHYAYVVSEGTNSKIQIFDLSYLPDSVHLVKTTSFPSHSTTHSITDMTENGRFKFLNGCNSSFVVNGGVAIMDCLDPENPVIRGKIGTATGGNTNGYVHDCRARNDTLWTCNIYTGYMTMYNIANKDSLKVIRAFKEYAPGGVSTHSLDFPKYTNKYMYVCDEITGTITGKMNIWDISDPTNYVQVGSWNPTGITTADVHNVSVYGNYGVVANYTAGIRLLDLSVPNVPVEIAWYDTYPSSNASQFNGCWEIFMFPSKKIIGSDINTGLYVVKPTLTITNIGYNNFASTQIPSSMELKQNFPNPFNPSTKINFSIPKNSFVTLKVYNLAGREVANLVNDRRDRGNYEVSFDAGKYGLSSGAYFYSLTADGYTETKKMILVK